MVTPVFSAPPDYGAFQEQQTRTNCIQFALQSSVVDVERGKANVTSDKIATAVLSVAREYEEYIING